MKKAEVTIGGTYQAKVSDKMTEVRIDSESPHGGWNATNLKTNKPVRIKSAQRLRGLAGAAAVEETATEDAPAPAAVPSGGFGDCAKCGRPVRGEAIRKSKKFYHPGCAERDGAPATKVTERKKTAREDGTMSGLDAAAKILEEAGEPLNCKAIVERAFEKGYWKPAGKTPAATLYSAILRELNVKQDAARFVKADRGMFKLK
jgi:hypothetical protein